MKIKRVIKAVAPTQSMAGKAAAKLYQKAASRINKRPAKGMPGWGSY